MLLANHKGDLRLPMVILFYFFYENKFLNTHTGILHSLTRAQLISSRRVPSQKGLTFDYVDQGVKPRGAS